MIGNNIASWRSKMNDGKGISRAHLARRIGVGRSFVTKLEKGIGKPGAELMFRVARYFKQPIEAIFWLVDGGGAKPGIICPNVIPVRQRDKPSAVLASAKPPFIPFPGVRPSAPVNQQRRQEISEHYER